MKIVEDFLRFPEWVKLVKSFLESNVLGVLFEDPTISFGIKGTFKLVLFVYLLKEFEGSIGPCELRIWKKKSGFNKIIIYHITKDYMTREYVETPSSRQKMEAMRKREDFHTKFARDNHNFYHDGSNGVNTYGGNNHGSENVTSERHNGVSNFSSYVKSYEHNSYDDYGVMKRSMLNMFSIVLMNVIKDLIIVMTMVIIVMVEEFTLRACI
ncbi:hypothetical protein M9H77_18120 [Catharanthus roseus]|uniref:Uncharacterized protein n=1 Tax=Catharanthus roseus TaxID=4058 RepID=A0ACC0B6I2_CATRO|nr:hypothetical protein M9H77_18120 [Catharanthus roseus]